VLNVLQADKQGAYKCNIKVTLNINRNILRDFFLLFIYIYVCRMCFSTPGLLPFSYIATLGLSIVYSYFRYIEIPTVLSSFSGGGLCTSMTRIAMLVGVFILLLGPRKSDRLKDRGQTKWQHRLLSFSLLFFFPLFSYSLLFLLFLCFSRPYITFLRCLDVIIKPLLLTHSLNKLN